jgi:hypothetical protein
MAVAEGLRRIKLVGKLILTIGLVLIIIALFGNLVLQHLYLSSFSPAMLVFGVIGLYLCLFGALLSAGAWILEGFLLKRTPSE